MNEKGHKLQAPDPSLSICAINASSVICQHAFFFYSKYILNNYPESYSDSLFYKPIIWQLFDGFMDYYFIVCEK